MPNLKRFAPEFRLMVAVLRLTLETATEDDVLGLLESEPIDWEEFARLLQRHRVLMPVWKGLCGRARLLERVPNEARVRLKALNRATVLRQMGLVKDLIDVAKALDRAGIRYVTLKGPALSQLLYGDPVARHCGDLDVLVRPENLERARDVLMSVGFAKKADSTDRIAERSADFVLLGHHWHFERRGLELELHWRLSGMDFGIEDSLEAITRRSRMVLVGGCRIPALGNDDLDRYLSIHASAHCFSRVKWLFDLACLRPSRSGGDDRDRALKWADTLCGELFGRRCQLNGDRLGFQRRAMNALACAQLRESTGDASTMANVLRRSVALVLRSQGFRAKLDCVGRIFAWRQAVDRIPLPRRLWWLYALIGPALWLGCTLRIVRCRSDETGLGDACLNR